MIADYIILALYAAAMIAIAFYTKNRSKSVNDFLLAGKKGLNGWMTAFSYGTSYFSAVIFIGYAGQFGRAFGLASIWIGIGNALIGTLIAWLVLAKRTKNVTRRLEAKTMPEFFEKRYGSKSIKLISAVIIFIFLIPYSASVYNGLSTLFEIILGIPGYIVMIALAVLTAVYLFFGGYFATSVSDFVQGIIMLVGVVCMVLCFMNSAEVNWNISSIIENPNLTWFTFEAESKGIYGSTVSLIALIILTSLGVWGLPQTIHKYYAIRDKKAISQGVVISTVFALIIGFAAYFTGALSSLFPETAGLPHSEVIPVMLSKVIPTGLIGVIAVLILSASMSTLASVSLVSSSVVAVDIYHGSINKKASDRKVNAIMKALCLVFVLISVVIALLNEKFGIAAIAYMMGLSWGTLSGCFFGPYVLGILWKRVTKAAMMVSIIGSPILTAVLVILFGYDKNGWNAPFTTVLKDGVATSPLIGVICIAFSILATVLVSLVTKKPDDARIAEAFDKHFEGEIQ